MNSKEIKEFAINNGATMTGIADVDRFNDAPPGMHPEDLLPGAKRVISIGVKILDSIIDWKNMAKRSKVKGSPIPESVYQDHLYQRIAYENVNTLIESISLKIAIKLESMGYISLPIPATYAHHAPVMDRVNGLFAPFSHRHAAVRAGLGEFGYNGLVLTQKYGPRVRFGSIITNMHLEADPLITDQLCLRNDCMLCVKKCKCNALDNVNLNKGGIFIDIPVEVDKYACYEGHREKLCVGLCISACPVGN